MQLYQCHKKVRAAKITNVRANYVRDLPQSTPTFTHVDLFLEGSDVPTPMSVEWNEKHLPRIGGYYVVYEDGYASYSPAQAFEEGYTLIDEGQVTRPFGACSITGTREDIAFIFKQLPDVDDAYQATVSSDPANKMPDAGLIERLRIHAADKRNTAFARSTMNELLELFGTK